MQIILIHELIHIWSSSFKASSEEDIYSSPTFCLPSSIKELWASINISFIVNACPKDLNKLLFPLFTIINGSNENAYDYAIAAIIISPQIIKLNIFVAFWWSKIPISLSKLKRQDCQYEKKIIVFTHRNFINGLNGLRRSSVAI